MKYVNRRFCLCVGAFVLSACAARHAERVQGDTLVAGDTVAAHTSAPQSTHTAVPNCTMVASDSSWPLDIAFAKGEAKLGSQAIHDAVKRWDSVRSAMASGTKLGIVMVFAYPEGSSTSASAQALALRRAEATRDLLLTLGVPADKMGYVGIDPAFHPGKIPNRTGENAAHAYNVAVKIQGHAGSATCVR